MAMGRSLATAYTRVLMDTTQLKTGMNKAYSMVQRGTKNMKKSWDRVSKSVFSLQNKLIGGAGAVGLVYAMKKLTDASNEQVNAEKQMEAVLKATGGAAGLTADELKEMASRLQGVSKFGDEATLVGQSLLLTFKNIKKDAFEPTLKVAMDMSTVMGQDLKSSLIQVGKAMNDPITGMSSLSRVGVTFTQAQKDMVKELQKSGDLMGAQAIILAELESQFGGASEAMRETFSGAVEGASMAFGDLKEELGHVITKNEFFIELVHMAEKQFVEWGNAIKDNRQYLMELAKNGVLYVADALGTAVETMRFFENGWLGIKLVGTTAINAIAIAIEQLMKGMRVLMAPLDAIFEGLKKIHAIKVNPFDSLSKSLETFSASSGDVVNEVWDDIEKTNKKYDTWKQAIGGVRDKIAEIPVVQTKAKKSFEATAPVVHQVVEEVKQTTKETKEAKKAAEELEKIFIRAAKAESDTFNAIEESRWKAQIAQETLNNETASAIDLQNRMADAVEDTGNEYGNWSDAVNDAEYSVKELADAQRKEQQAATENMRIHGTLFDGLKMGWKDTLASQVQWGREGERVVKEFSAVTEATLGDTLFMGLKGEWDSIADAWKGLMDDMLRQATSFIAKMVVEFAKAKLFGGAGGAGGLLGGLFGGGGGGGGLFGGGGGGGIGGIAKGIGGIIAKKLGLGKIGLGKLGGLFGGAGAGAGAAGLGTMTGGALAAQAGLTQAGLHTALGSATYGGGAGAGSMAGGAGAGGGAAAGGAAFAIVAAASILAQKGLAKQGPRATQQLAAWESGQDTAFNPKTGQSISGIQSYNEAQVKYLQQRAMMEEIGKGGMSQGMFEVSPTYDASTFDRGYIDDLEDIHDMVNKMGEGKTLAEIVELGEGSSGNLMDETIERLAQYKELMGSKGSGGAEMMFSMGLDESSLNDLAQGPFMDAMAALNVVQGENGWTSQVTLDFIEQMGKAEHNITQKLEALGFVGEKSGWGSKATVSMIADMIDSGVPWKQISSKLETYGVADDQIIKDIVGHYTDEGMSFADLDLMLKEAGVPEHLIREIHTTVDDVKADVGSFNNFKMGVDVPPPLAVAPIPPVTVVPPGPIEVGSINVPPIGADGKQFNDFKMDYSGPTEIYLKDDRVGHSLLNGGQQKKEKPIVINLTIPIEGLDETLQETINIIAKDSIKQHEEIAAVGIDRTRTL